MSYLGLLRMTSMSLVLAAAGVALLSPNDADACSPKKCADSPRFLHLALGAAEIAPDGVVAFDTSQGSDQIVPAQDVLELIRVTVTAADETPISGALEHDGGIYFWRPDAALPAGTTLSVSVNIDNDALDPESACGVDAYGPLALSIAESALPDLALPEVPFEAFYDLQPQLQLDSVVCCDGAYPELSVGSCIDEVYWSQGHCTAIQGTGFAGGQFDLSGLDPLLAASVRVEVLADGEAVSSALGSLVPGAVGTSRSEAFEAQVRLVSLIDGSTVQSDAVLADGGMPDGLGRIALDVTADLARNCESTAYTCEVDGEFGQAWDPEACDPWDDGGGDTDGETDSDSGSDSGSDSDSDSGSDSGSDSDSDAGSGSGSGGDTDGGAGQDDGGGCQVGTHSSGGGWLMLLGLGALPFLRRRR